MLRNRAKSAPTLCTGALAAPAATRRDDCALRSQRQSVTALPFSAQPVRNARLQPRRETLAIIRSHYLCRIRHVMSRQLRDVTCDGSHPLPADGSPGIFEMGGALETVFSSSVFR